MHWQKLSWIGKGIHVRQAGILSFFILVAIDRVMVGSSFS